MPSSSNIPKFTESALEESVLTLFERGAGYLRGRGDSLNRRQDEALLLDDLRAYLAERYASENLTEQETEQIVARLRSIPSTPLYEGSRATFRLINEGFDLTREDNSKSAVHVEYIDFERPTRNIFRIVGQLSFQGSSLRRPDALVYVNGVPVSIFEFKSAIREEATLADAWEQITVRYRRDIPDLLKYCFLSVVSDGANTKIGTIFTPYAHCYAWKKIEDGDAVSDGLRSLKTTILGAFSKERLVAILRDFVFYPDDSKKEVAVVCRYPQFFAANKIFARIRKSLRPDGDGKGGVYFGATGCGKTYAMLFLARLLALRDASTFRNPTIIIIVDREDLDAQTSKLFATAKNFLRDQNVRSIESRDDLLQTLKSRPSGGVYITTIQKFCEKTGLLSDRSNIVCISDEAHRTQTGVGLKLKSTDKGLFYRYGFAKYLRDSFPNATYCGFTGTPLDETVAVFGEIVDRYTMKEACADGITVRIAYEPRLARLRVLDDEAKAIQRYYERCASSGSTPEQIERSQRESARLSKLLGRPARLNRMARDLVEHYEKLCATKPKVVQKAMIVCNEREIALNLVKAILAIRPDWGKAKRAEDESVLTPERLDKLAPIPKINLIATRDKDDPKELYDVCGTKERRKNLAILFKNDDSNFKIAVVVDMWITGFDVPSLAAIYIDKPLQRHTLIQTISRVNRVFDGKDKGLVVDYIGFYKEMQAALKQYGGADQNPVDDLNVSLSIFRNNLAALDELIGGFDATRYYRGDPLERLYCLNDAAEFVQTSKERENKFMATARVLKSAYAICFPSGELSDEEIIRAQFYMAIRSIIYKQTKGDAPDVETMNAVVEEMASKAIECSGVEAVFQEGESTDLFSESFQRELESVKAPTTKFNALLKLLRKAIGEYKRVNRTKALEFDERLKATVEKYNERDDAIVIGEVVGEFVDRLSDELVGILRDLKDDQKSFEGLGISFEEKIFYDILASIRDKRGFEYPNEKCVDLAKQVKALVDEKAQHADWHERHDV